MYFEKINTVITLMAKMVRPGVRGRGMCVAVFASPLLDDAR